MNVDFINFSCANKNITEIPSCPLSLEPFIRPWILLEDGFTYEKSYIEEWLKKKPNTSPMIGDIPSATLLPNCALTKANLVCSITQEPFKEPYYCQEDGHTYEKEAILKWVETSIEKCVKQGDHTIYFRSPASGVRLNSLTLYPNKLLFKSKIPHDQKPVVIQMNLNEILSKLMTGETKCENTPCVYDDTIRNLIKHYSNTEDSNLKLLLANTIHERRKELGLSIHETYFRVIDLSFLDLSNMTLKDLQLKCALLKMTNLSNTTLVDCDLGRVRFLECNLKYAFFKKCHFGGEEVSFFKSDMTGAAFSPECYLEKGDTWKGITHWNDFLSELKNRGALNVDTVSLRNLS